MIASNRKVTMIASNHPVRELFADLSTGGGHYTSKDSAYYAFNDILAVFHYHLESRFRHGSDSSETIIIRDDCNDLVGRAHFSCHRMYHGGRWEVIGRIT